MYYDCPICTYFMIERLQTNQRMVHAMQLPVFCQPVSETLVIVCRCTECLRDRLNRKMILSQYFFAIVHKGSYTSDCFLFPLNRETASAN